MVPWVFTTLKRLGILISPELKNEIIAKYGMTDNGQVQKVIFPGEKTEAFWEGSFYSHLKDKQAPTMADMISRTEIIEGLPFVSFEDVLYFKHKMKRDKDLEDVRLVQEWQKVNEETEK